MIFFTGIVFIAELIIIYNIVVFLVNTDKKVCALTEHINKRRIILRWRMETITDITSGINEILPNIKKNLEKRRKKMILQWTNEIAQGIALLLFKPKYKKLLIGTRTGISLVRKLLKI